MSDKLLQQVSCDPELRNEVIVKLRPYVNQLTRMFLSDNPSFGYLKEDLQSEGYLATTHVCQVIAREGTYRAANMGYLTAAIRNAFLDAIANEQVMRGELKRTYIRETYKPCERQQWADTVDELSPLSKRQRQILFMRLEGYTDNEIAEETGTTLKQIRCSRSHIQNKMRRTL